VVFNSASWDLEIGIGLWLGNPWYGAIPRTIVSQAFAGWSGARGELGAGTLISANTARCEERMALTHPPVSNNARSAGDPHQTAR